MRSSDRDKLLIIFMQLCTTLESRKGETDVVSFLADSDDKRRKPVNGREIPRRYHDIVAEFHTISQYKKFPRFEP